MKNHAGKINIITIVILVVIAAAVVIYYFMPRKPADVSDEYYKYGKAALEIVDQYLDYEITVDEASEALKELERREGTLPSKTSHADTMIKLCVSASARHVSSINLDTKLYRNVDKSKYNDLVEKRNELADYLGVK